MHSRDIVKKHLKKLQPLNYSQFRWWRNYQVPKPLPKSTFIEKRVNNGDFDPSPYFWMAQSALWEKHDNDTLDLEDFERARRGSLLLTKYERLMHDFEVDDKERLDSFVDAIYDTFEIDKENAKEEIEKFGKTIKDYYIYAKENYKVRRVAPKRRGRPKKQ